LLLIPLLKLFGIVGAAAAQALASALFAGLFLYYVHKHTIPYSLGNLVRHAFIGPLMMGIGLYVCYVLVTPSGPLSLVSAIGLGFTVSIVYAAYAYRLVLMPNHRQRMHAFFRASIRLGR
jgi:O-antigen/teichoic acid export membrane protein